MPKLCNSNLHPHYFFRRWFLASKNLTLLEGRAYFPQPTKKRCTSLIIKWVSTWKSISVLLETTHSQTDWTLARYIVKVSTVKWAISKLTSYKSSGEDGIILALLQNEPEFLVMCMTRISSEPGVDYGYIPQVWKINKIVINLICDLSDETNVKPYRPICLSSFFLKSLERLVKRYIRKRVLSSVPLPQN